MQPWWFLSLVSNFDPQTSRLHLHLSFIITNTMADSSSPAPSPVTRDDRPAISPSNPSNDPSKTGYDPSARWTNYYNILTSKMTREGQEAFREDAYIRNESRDVANAEKWRDYLFEYSPTIRFLNSKIRDLNGNLDKDNVHCRRCPTRTVIDEETGEKKMVRQGGGFSPDHGILICANEMRNQGHLEDTLAHEMVHAWDHLRWKVDWSDLRHAACTEVSPSPKTNHRSYTEGYGKKLTHVIDSCIESEW